MVREDRLPTLIERYRTLVEDRLGGSPAVLPDDTAPGPDLSEVLAIDAWLDRVLGPLPASPREERGSAPPAARLGPYRILRELGRGGMGVVWLAEEEPLGRLVALKCIPAEALAPDALRRFDQEARIAAGLDHEAVVPVLAVGIHEGQATIAMRFLPGGSLAECVKRGALPAAEVIEAGRRLASALALAHARGIVHRDVKPANVLFDAEGHAYLGDFGLARSESGEHLTQSGMVAGTPAYMAPEQIAGADPAPAHDLYALGVTLFEAVTGVHPSAGCAATPSRGLTALPPRRDRRRMPRDLETILLALLDPNPGRRYASAATLAGDFDRVARGEPPLGAGSPRTARALRQIRRRLPVIAAGLLLAGLTAVAAHDGFLRREATETRIRSFLDGHAEAVAAGDWPAAADVAAVLRAGAAVLARIGASSRARFLRGEAWRLYAEAFDLRRDAPHWDPVLLEGGLRNLDEADGLDGGTPGSGPLRARLLRQLGRGGPSPEPAPETGDAACQAESMIETARRLLARRRLEEAETLALQYLDSRPRDSRGVLLLGLIAHELRRPESAETVLRLATQVRGRELDVWTLLGEVRFARQDLEGTLRLAEQVLARDPTRARALLLRAEVAWRRGDRAAAHEDVERAVAVQPRYHEAWIHRSQMHLELHDAEAALADLDQALALEPRNATALTNRADLLQAAGRREEGLESARRALEIMPDHIFARLQVARLTAQDGHEPEALALLEAGRRILKDEERFRRFESSIHLRFARRLLREGDAEAALGHAIRARDLGESAEAADPVAEAARRRIAGR